MKRKLLLAVALLFSGLTYAQDIPAKDVPLEVRNSFQKAFPNATKVEWELKGDLYNADFDIGRRDHEVWFTNKGAIVKHKKEISAKELPVAVSNVIKKNYTGYRIDDVDQFQEGKVILYKVELKKVGDEKKIVFDAKGGIVNRIL
ncbi:PepSY-like domain-containing protein [Pedobacter gandavensis]|uniref:PepSY-like domain-containing protein n=1 Tax=Pedobacter gandavensis TaxID=2679963 RepID=UPI0029314400|nr:PepSY-like domain-containing protein [Pedobacter gandavensis]